MSTPSSLPQAVVRAPIGDTLARVAPRRALRGFGNLLQNETRAWWGTRKWLVHLVIWVAIINGFAGVIGWAEGRNGDVDDALHFRGAVALRAGGDLDRWQGHHERHRGAALPYR
jgi:hypothetical protein